MDLTIPTNQLYDIVKEYRHDDGLCLTREDIERWGMQFGSSASFVLSETAYVFNETYFSKERMNESIKAELQLLVDSYYDGDWKAFSEQCFFLDLQGIEKSQAALVKMAKQIVADFIVDEQLQPSKNPVMYLYIDDICVSCNTFEKSIQNWLFANCKKIENGEIRFVVYHACMYDWEMSLRKFRLIKLIEKENPNANASKIINKMIRWDSTYTIENKPNFINCKYNLIRPKEFYFKSVEKLYDDLKKTPYSGYERTKANIALRSSNEPRMETFFSSSESRDKYEKIMLEFGMHLLNGKVNLETNAHWRPLGFTTPSYATLGSGCLVATWRNAPNNMPLPFWWETDNWKPLLSRKISK